MPPVMPSVERPQARPRFRRLAAVLAVLCFLLTALFGWFLDDGKGSSSASASSSASS